jgi:O-methyltransferase
MALPSIIGHNNIQAMIALAETAPLGCFCEVGVFHGGSAYELYQVTSRQNRELHLFDTFTGTPVYTEGLDRHKIDSEFADKSAQAKIRDLMPLAHLHIGVYPDTHPKDLKDIAFIHCDCDQYISYCAVIDVMWPLVVPSGIMLFDDYPYLAGAKRAVEEHFGISSLQKCGEHFYVTKGLGLG